MMKLSQAFSFLRSAILWSLVGAVVAGGIAGWSAAQMVVSSLGRGGIATGVTTTTPTTTAPKVEIVPVESRPLLPAYPSAFSVRRASSVLTLVKKSTPTKMLLEDRIVAADRAVGSAVALTADGWLVTTHSVIGGGARVGEVEVVWDGRTYSIQRAIRDVATDAVFLKIDAKDLPVATLTAAENVSAGVALWMEPRARQLYPGIIIETRLKSATTVLSSERATRRFLASGNGDANWAGGATWDSGGGLIGLMEEKTSAGWNLLPAGAIATALSSLLTTNEIRHASLGIRSIDLGSAVFEQGRESLPAVGAWLRPDRRLGLPAVTLKGPAAQVLVDGDVIERIERDILDGGADLGERLLAYRPGVRVTVYGQRKGQPLEISLTLGSVIASEILK